MMVFLLLVSGGYFLFVIMLIINWNLGKSYQGESDKKVSLIIAVRNEEQNIEQLLKSLLDQTYQNFEIIIVDDGSTDATVDIINSFDNDKIVCFANEGKGKKQALKNGIKRSQGEIIVCTDGDCTVGEDWLKTMVAPFVHTQIKLVSGPVVYKAYTLFEKLQQIEFSSLIGTGAATINMRSPTMCNGANIAYLKKAYEEVEGFEGNEIVASGDDEFLMHKIHKYYGNQSVVFQKDRQAIVKTTPNKTFQNFYYQRKRWASKWGYYQLMYVKLLAVAVFFIHLFFPFMLVVGVLGKASMSLVVVLWTLKFIVEGIFLTRVLTFLNVKKQLLLFFVVEILYDFYVVFFALISWGKGYKWKGRLAH